MDRLQVKKNKKNEKPQKKIPSHKKGALQIIQMLTNFYRFFKNKKKSDFESKHVARLFALIYF